MRKLQDKVAVVTGASKGIGAAIAKSLAAAGASVVVNYASAKDGADKVVADITAKGGKAVAVQGDVSKFVDVKQLFREARAAFGAPDILVNNAGVFAFAPLENVEVAEFHRQFDTNVLGTILHHPGSRAKHFGHRAAGSVINVGSVASTRRRPGSAVYAATKGVLSTPAEAALAAGARRRARSASTSSHRACVEIEGTHSARRHRQRFRED